MAECYLGGQNSKDIEIPLLISNGGTGATTAAAARANIGAAKATMKNGPFPTGRGPGMTRRFPPTSLPLPPGIITP